MCIQGTIMFAVSIVSGKAIHELEIVCKENDYCTCLEMFKLWAKTTYKMSGVYTCVVIHLFDFATDLLVIREWFMAEDSPNEDVEGVDAALMAWNSIGVLIFYRIVSSFGVYATANTEKRILTLLQFLDVLLFVEIYATHKKLVRLIVNKYNVKNDAPHGDGSADVIGMCVLACW